MKLLIAVTLVAASINAQAYDDIFAQPTYPGGMPRLDRGGYATDRQRDETIVYPTHKGGGDLRDLSRPGYVIQQDRGTTRLQPTHPGTDIPDLRQPGYLIERRR